MRREWNEYTRVETYNTLDEVQSIVMSIIYFNDLVENQLKGLDHYNSNVYLH